MLRAERLGTLDGLNYLEMSHEELLVFEKHIEIDAKAGGLEGSGTVRQVGKGAERFRFGDRVAILKN